LQFQVAVIAIDELLEFMETLEGGGLRNFVCNLPAWKYIFPGWQGCGKAVIKYEAKSSRLCQAMTLRAPGTLTLIGGVAQWLERRSLNGGLSLICTRSMVDV